MGERGFEPLKAEPTGLQPVPFGHLGTPPADAHCSHRLRSRTACVRPIRGEAMDLNALLSAAVTRGGSDLHLKVDSRPMARIDGELVAVGEQVLTDADLEAALYHVTERSPVKRDLFNATGDLDTAYTAEGVGR